MQFFNSKYLFLTSLFILALTLAPDLAHATSAGAAMPYDSWLDTIQRSLTGKVAQIIMLLAMFCAGFPVVVMGAEMHGFVKSFLMLIFFGAFLLEGSSIMSRVFTGGATAPVAIEKTVQPANAKLLAANNLNSKTSEQTHFAEVEY